MRPFRILRQYLAHHSRFSAGHRPLRILAIGDGETGLLADNAPQALRAAIEMLLEDASLQQSIAQASVADADRRFNLTMVCLEYLRVFFLVLEMSGVRAK